MPNWCDNRLTITGDKKQITAFKNKAKINNKNKKTDLSLNKFNPLPKELKNTSSPATIVSEKDYTKEVAKTRTENKKNKEFLKGLPITTKISKALKKKYGFDNWYDWQVENWGTKWDIGAELVDYDNELLLYQFSSAWSPPVAWLEKASKLYPKLHFILKYEEEGVNFMGVAKAHKGEVDNQCIDY